MMLNRLLAFISRYNIPFSTKIKFSVQKITFFREFTLNFVQNILTNSVRYIRAPYGKSYPSIRTHSLISAPYRYYCYSLNPLSELIVLLEQPTVTVTTLWTHISNLFVLSEHQTVTVTTISTPYLSLRPY